MAQTTSLRGTTRPTALRGWPLRVRARRARERVVGRSNPGAANTALDCFATLAMTKKTLEEAAAREKLTAEREQRDDDADPADEDRGIEGTAHPHHRRDRGERDRELRREIGIGKE